MGGKNTPAIERDKVGRGNSASAEALWIKGSVCSASTTAECAASQVWAESEVHIGFSVQVPPNNGKPREGGDNFSGGEMQGINKSWRGVGGPGDLCNPLH